MYTRLKKRFSIATCLFFILISCAIIHQVPNRLDANEEGEHRQKPLSYNVWLAVTDDNNLKHLDNGDTKGFRQDELWKYNFGENGAIDSSLSRFSDGEGIDTTDLQKENNIYNYRKQDHDDDDDDDDDDDYHDDDHYGNVLFNDPTDAGRPSPSFQDDILPILTNRCAFAGCHVARGPDGVDLRTYDAVMAGGHDGAIVIAGNARRSELVEEIVEGEMPPDGPPLPAAQIQLIIDWINEGAKNNSNNETNAASDNPTDAGRPIPSFQDDILPILTNRCAFAGCHVAGGPGGIDLRTYDAVMAGGSKGAIVIAGDAGESELVTQIVEGKMPPGGPPLPAAQIQLITDWINDGAKNNLDGEADREPPIPPDSSPSPDVNRDGVVDILDLIQAAFQFGQVGTHLAGDVNGDGTVDVADLILISVGLSGNAAMPAPPVDDSNLTANYHPSSVKRQFQALAALELLATPSYEVRLARDLLKAWLARVKPSVTETKLLPNYPNPFNPETWIPYQLAEAAYVKIHIYDVVGNLVRTLDLGTKPVGNYLSRERAAYWDGRNDMGEEVSSGVYFYTLIAEDYQTTRRMIVTR